LIAYLRNKRIIIEEVDITQIDVFNEVERIVEKYSIDLADALQLVTLKRGISAKLTGDSKPILLTADAGLESSAKSEDLRVWNCLKKSAP